MTDQTNPTNGAAGANGKLASVSTEAPASWNVKYLLEGFDCMLTLRGESGADLLPRSLKALEWLRANGAEPTRAASQPQPATQATPAPILPDGQPDPAWCKIHGVAMARHEKDGHAWYSHKMGDTYCKGKA